MGGGTYPLVGKMAVERTIWITFSIRLCGPLVPSGHYLSMGGRPDVEFVTLLAATQGSGGSQWEVGGE